MNKALVLAALLGLAASTSVMKWSKSDAALVAKDDLLRLGYELEFDFGYGSHYMGTDPVDDVDDQQSETYGVHLYSDVIFTLNAELFDSYMHTCEVELVPLYFAPYEHTVTWVRMEDGSDFGLSMSGDRNLEAGVLTTTVTNNAKTFMVSLWDVIDDGRDVTPASGDWSYNEDYEHEYEDPYYSLNIFEKLDIIDGSESWYGSHNYYTADII